MRVNLMRWDKRVLFSGLVLLLLAVVNLAWNSPPARHAAATPPAAEATLTRTPLPTQPAVTDSQATLTPTPLPAELLANFQQTTGIIIVAAVLVLIVAAGVFNQLLSERESRL